MNPSTVEVVLPIVQREVTQAYVVKPLLRGTPADGFNVTSISVDPSFVVITGAIEALQSLTTVSTDEVAVDGAASDVVRAAKLQLPPGLTVAGSDSVTVRVSVSPAQGEITLGLTPTVKGLEPGLRAELATTMVEVRVAGEIPVLRALSPTSLVAVVDASGLGEGQHVLPVQVTVPPGVRVVGVEPATVIVTLSTA
jgi:YbbR domain-containing protein